MYGMLEKTAISRAPVGVRIVEGVVGAVLRQAFGYYYTFEPKSLFHRRVASPEASPTQMAGNLPLHKVGANESLWGH